jgi:hypothetical protein
MAALQAAPVAFALWEVAAVHVHPPVVCDDALRQSLQETEVKARAGGMTSAQTTSDAGPYQSGIGTTDGDFNILYAHKSNTTVECKCRGLQPRP